MSYVISIANNQLILFYDDQKELAERNAQAIREGMWQCNMTEEPWKKGAKHMIKGEDGTGTEHTCSEECLDNRTDDLVRVDKI